MRPSAALLAACLLPIAVAAAPTAERWSAVSHTATGITGDILLSPTRFTAAGQSLPLAVAADLPAFTTDQGDRPARILRVTRPADPVLLNGNRLCGAPVRWIVAVRAAAGRELHLAVFSGERRPASESGAGLCGTFLYAREGRAG